MFGRTRLVGMSVMVTATLMLVTPAMAAAVVPAAQMPTISGSWSHIPPLQSNVAVMTATGGQDGRLYVFGFCDSGDPCPQTGGTVGYGSPVTYRYDRGTGMWQARRPAPGSCSNAEASALGIDGKIRLADCSGELSGGSGFREAIYDPQQNTWSMKPGHGPNVSPIAGMTVPDGRIFWYSETLSSDGAFSTGHRVVVERLDGSYRKKAIQPKTGPEDFGPSDGAGLGSDGKVYVAGGDRDCRTEFGACTVPPVEAWSPQSDAWTKPTVLPTARINIAVTGDAQGRIFTVGGFSADGSRMFSKVEVYRPSSGTWAKAANLPDDRFAASAAFTANGRVWVVAGYDSSGNPLTDGYVFTP